MRKNKETHKFDFRSLALAIREAREKAGLFHDLVTMFNISVDKYFYSQQNVAKTTLHRQIEISLDELTDNQLKIIQGTIDGILKSRESEK